jgi:hypothetical protein
MYLVNYIQVISHITDYHTRTAHMKQNCYLSQNYLFRNLSCQNYLIHHLSLKY